MDGKLETREDGQWQLRFVRSLSHPPEKVWRALTEEAHQASWMPARMEGERTVGSALRFVFPEDPSVESGGEMLVYDPPRLLEYSWDGERLRWELRPVAGGCELTLLAHIDQVGRAARDSAGWHVCLDLLEHHLDGRPPEWKPEDRWRPLSAHYGALFGPESTTIGPPDWHPESQRE